MGRRLQARYCIPEEGFRIFLDAPEVHPLRAPSSQWCAISFEYLAAFEGGGRTELMWPLVQTALLLMQLHYCCSSNSMLRHHVAAALEPALPQTLQQASHGLMTFLQPNALASRAGECGRSLALQRPLLQSCREGIHRGVQIDVIEVRWCLAFCSPKASTTSPRL